MTVFIIISARYASRGHPAKQLVPLKDRHDSFMPLIQRILEAALTADLVDAGYVASDDALIAEAATSFGPEVVMTGKSGCNGSRRWRSVAHRVHQNTRSSRQCTLRRTEGVPVSELESALWTLRKIDVTASPLGN